MGTFPKLVGSLLTIGTCALGSASAARAQPTLGCDRDAPPNGPSATFPASGANSVTLDAPLRVTYSPGFLDDASVTELLEVFACLDNTCAERLPVDGDISAIDNELFFLPAPSWNPFTQYRGTAFGTDRSLQFSFTTGSSVDVSPPAFSGALSINTEPTQAPCHKEGDAGDPPRGYRVEVSFAPATDDGAPGDIEYQLFLTRGPNIGGAQLVAQSRNFGATERLSLAFFLDEDTAKQTHCVDLIVIDGVGNVTDARSHECFNATLGRDFVGCRLSGRSSKASVTFWLLLVATPLAFGRRKQPTASQL